MKTRTRGESGIQGATWLCMEVAFHADDASRARKYGRETDRASPPCFRRPARNVRRSRRKRMMRTRRGKSSAAKKNLPREGDIAKGYALSDNVLRASWKSERRPPTRTHTYAKGYATEEQEDARRDGEEVTLSRPAREGGQGVDARGFARDLWLPRSTRAARSHDAKVRG